MSSDRWYVYASRVSLRSRVQFIAINDRGFTCTLQSRPDNATAFPYSSPTSCTSTCRACGRSRMRKKGDVGT